MAMCKDMKVGDMYVCETCGLTLKVERPCNCSENEPTCTVPLSCCGKEMKKV